ncbi:MAG: GTPase HflX [Clostridia bacterium]|nr:GTPase HflX [Clostridia bacterium]
MAEHTTIGQRAVLVGIAADQRELAACQTSLDELERLLNTAGGEAFARMVQVRASYNARTCIGSGKVAELAELCKNEDIHLAVFDFDLSPSQIRNLEDDLSDVRVIDRSMLILDIFALHATSGEGKLQVELAQLKYTAPRLTGHGTELSRLGGTIGTRGPGETQLEIDRRHMKRRIDALEAQLAEMESTRATMRAARDRSGIPKVAIVGYTNAGKSTLLNYLTDAGVLSEDKLFATLDPTTRRLDLEEGESLLLTDTVGFIRKLPHHLVKAFRSTLEEAAYADILLVLIDATDAEGEEHLGVTEQLLEELGAGDKPILYVFNKCDRVPELLEADNRREDTVYISAATGEGVDTLLSRLLTIVRQEKRRVRLCFPYTEQGRVSAVYHYGAVENLSYEEHGVVMDVILDKRGLGVFRDFLDERDRLPETEEDDDADYL